MRFADENQLLEPGYLALESEIHFREPAENLDVSRFPEAAAAALPERGAIVEPRRLPMR